MPAPLRAFISSTMDDLGNERRAVAARLRHLGIEPVNAEDLPPDGSSSWSLLQKEIKSCEIFILISGQRYGWIPATGAGSDEQLSITHLEYRLARELGLIILPFFITLKAGENKTDDTNARDLFRKEVAEWEASYFRQTFTWADELADRVGKAVSGVLGQALRRELQAKSAQMSVQRARLEEAPSADLHAIVARAPWTSSSAVLLAGAGMSIAAGYPTAASLTEILTRDMGLAASGDDLLTRHVFAEMATIFEQRQHGGREALVRRISSAFLQPGAFGPTQAHLAAVRVFGTIVTTNLDQLFEAACNQQAVPYTVITPASAAMPSLSPEGPVIFKINGTIELPQSLILSRQDVDVVAKAEWLWSALQMALKGKPLIVVGHSLRDDSSKRLPSAGVHNGGAYVSPFLSDIEAFLLRKYSLTGVRADADSFMIAYEQTVASRGKPID